MEAMTDLARDVRYAVRSLRRSPGFAAVAIVTLALGIGANTAIFSVVHGVLLRPLAFRQPQDLVRLEERDKEGRPNNTGYATYLDWRSRNRSFEDVVVVADWKPRLAGAAGVAPEKLEGVRVSDGFLRLLGVRPALGRDFLPSEAVRENRFVVLLSDGLWRRRFGADPAIPGKSIRLGDTPYLVAGVLPPGFESIFQSDTSRPAEILAPLGYNTTLPWACRTCRHLRALARLRAGVPLAHARAEINALSESLFREYPGDYSASGVFVTPLAKALTARTRPALLTLLGAVSLVLLIGCANVASLLMSRASRRRKEIAVRTALGASSGRIARLCLVEALVIALAGGALGWFAAGLTLRTLVGLAPGNLPRLASIQLDGGVLLFTLGVSLLTGLLFGIVPAARLARLEPEAVLRGAPGGSRGRESRRVSGMLVVFDVALAFVLLCGALLLVRSASRLLNVDPGFRAEGLLTMEVDVSGDRYEKDEAVRGFYDRVLERVTALPGVTNAGVVSQLPLGGNYDGYGVHAEDRNNANPELDPSAERYSVSDGYLSTMGIPVLRGRGISATDGSDAAPVVLVNETLARQLWGDEDPLGKRVRVGGTDGPLRTVVGVVGTVRHQALEEPATPQIYLPRAQRVDGAMVLVIRASNPASLSSAARAAIASVDPDQPVTKIATMPRVVAASTSGRRFSAGLLALFAALATLLTSVGIFGVVSASVSERTREIGIRIALGADRGAIARLISSRTLSLTALGIGLGLLGSLATGRLVESQLYQVRAHDPSALMAGAAFLVAVALAAGYGPVRRAVRTDPIDALRSE
jgi:putative ABC transport system permease protein